MYGTVFLNVTTIFYDDLAPVTPDGGSRAHIHIFANDDIAGDNSLRVYES
jgi:hypothetical protein